jgi:hypothetical protein
MSSRRRGYVGLAIAAVVALGIVSAQAVDQPISAIKLIMKISASGSQKMVFVAKDPAFLFPAIGSPDDPANGSPGGAIIDILTRDGGDAEFVVPPGESTPTGWKSKAGTVDLYKYVNKDAPSGPTALKVVVLKETKVLKLVGKSVGLPLTGTLGDVVVRVTTGSLRNCARFDAATIRRDEPGKFIAKGALASSLTDCVNGPPTTSTSSTTSTSTSTSTSSSSTTSTSSTTTSSTSTTSTSTSSTTTTSTSTSSTTTTSTSSTTTTTLVLEFVTSDPSLATASGVAKNGGSAGTTLKTLHVGGLNLGGGCNQDGGACGIAEGPTPGGSSNRFNASCSGGSCTITSLTAAQTGSSTNCSAAGCSFGTFLPISNTATSTCVRNVFASPGSGTLTLAGAFTGSVPLTSNTTLTGNGASPCPLCLGGTPLVVDSGTCDHNWTDSSSNHSSTQDASCTPTDTAGHTYDCVPFGADLGGLSVNLTPFSSGTVSVDTGGTGNFCGQGATEPGSIGCFATHKSTGMVCDYIEEDGINATGISIGGGPVSTQLVSVFCVPPVGGIFGGLINGAADLPGPGATALPGTLELIQ